MIEFNFSIIFLETKIKNQEKKM